MHILTISPFTKTREKELAYFSREEIPPGSLVEVPLRQRRVMGLILGSAPAGILKSELRQAPFALRGQVRLLTENSFPAGFISAAEEEACYHGATLGNVLAAAVPNVLAEVLSKHSSLLPPSRELGPPTRLALMAPVSARARYYTTRIREIFERGCSVFFTAPTVAEVLWWEKTFASAGLSMTLLHGELPLRERRKRIGHVLSFKKPILIIATPSLLFFPRADIGMYILEREGSRAWRTGGAPYLDWRHFGETLAGERKASLILGDSLLRLETWEKVRQGATTLVKTSHSYQQPIAKIVETVRENKKVPGASPKRLFKVLDDEVQTLLKHTAAESKRSFLLVTRRGFAPETVCADCGETVLCSRCAAAMTLRKPTRGGTFFLCRRCGVEESAERRCKNCGSWNLLPLGRGAERIKETLRGILPPSSIFSISENAGDRKTEESILTAFRNTAGATLVGTERMLPTIPEVNTSVLISLDSLLAVPDFRMQERALRIILTLREKTTGTLLIPTRHPESIVAEALRTGVFETFYTAELAERTRLSFPPTTVILKVTATGNRSRVLKESAALEETLAQWNPIKGPALFRDKKKFLFHLFLIRPKEAWPEEGLQKVLRTLPPSVRVEVSPETLF